MEGVFEQEDDRHSRISVEVPEGETRVSGGLEDDVSGRSFGIRQSEFEVIKRSKGLIRELIKGDKEKVRNLTSPSCSSQTRSVSSYFSTSLQHSHR